VISSKGLRRRAAAVMVDFGVRGYSVRVGAVQRGTWAHCDYTKREIVFGRALLWTDWIFVNQIILHEVAHAIAGTSAGHGPSWMTTARAMGYRLAAKVPYADRVVGVHRWVATCETGMHSAIRYTRAAADGVLGCKPCVESGAGDVGVFWERL
jgi:hypothetical protein